MTEVVGIEKYDEVYLKIHCEPSTAMELSEHFTFTVPGAKFMPAVKNKFWDGKIRLFNVMTKMVYVGLLRYVEEFCRSREYIVEHLSDFSSDEFSVKEAKEFISTLNMPLEPRDYQIEAFVTAVRERRALLLSPTGSGKSLIIYLLMRYYGRKTLIIVPTVSLVSQLASDFDDYGFKSDRYVHRVVAGQPKSHEQKPITISTWQSLYKLPQEYFDQFDVIIGDEAHLFKAKSLTGLMQKTINSKYKFATTGTLDGSETHRLVLEGLFGIVKKVTTTKELIDSKHLAQFQIKCIVLTYDEHIKQMLSSYKYHDEIDYLVQLPERNRFIKNLALSLNGNTLLLFQFVEKHGRVLYEAIKKEAAGRPIYFIHGKVEGEEREEIRKIVETETNAIIVASYGTFSTGVNIKNLHNIIFSSPSKSRIRNLQSIGRGLRTSVTKDSAVLYDIADDLTWMKRKNFTLLHFIERVKIYAEEKFPYKIYQVNLKVNNNGKNN